FIGEDGVLEIKCPFTRCFYKDGMPSYHKAQVYGLLGISKRAYCDYCVWIPNGGIYISRLNRTPDFLEEWAYMKEILEAFYDTHEDLYKERQKALSTMIGNG
ncbi:MAG: hypothetical protein WB421_13875, partial [Terriglobales bacterium]